MIEYKVIIENSVFITSSLKNNAKAIEIEINELAKKGWRVVSVSGANDYGVIATLERDTRNTP